MDHYDGHIDAMKARERWPYDVCMCGDMMHDHTVGHNHAPVSMADYDDDERHKTQTKRNTSRLAAYNAKRAARQEIAQQIFWGARW